MDSQGQSHQTQIFPILTKTKPTACFREDNIQKRLETIMILCTFSNITVFVPSEKESLPYKRSDSEGV